MKSGRTKGSAAGVRRSKNQVKGAVSEFFDSKAGIFTATMLALFLWWVPYLGPMAAGFMGGRKAGSLFRGVITGAVSCVIVMIVMSVMSIVVSGLLYGDYSESFRSNVPFLYEKMEEFMGYVDSFVEVRGTSIFFDQSNYFLLIALALIGGVFADQNRKEVKAIVDLTKESNQAPLPRSVRAYRDKRSLGFQTYEDYARMSVNIPSAAESEAEKKAPKKAPATDVEAPVQTVHVQQTQTVESVSTSSVSPAASSTTVPETPRPAPKSASSADDYEFL